MDCVATVDEAAFFGAQLRLRTFFIRRRYFMKKSIGRLLTILLLFTAIAFCFTGCTKKTYTVTFMSYVSTNQLMQSGGGKKYDTYLTKQVEEGSIIGNVDIDDTVVLFDSETHKNVTYKFCGWFTDKSYGVQWNLMLDPVNGDITLYSKWEAE